jgi:hypothetical protein
VVDYKSDPVSVELGIGHGFTTGIRRVGPQIDPIARFLSRYSFRAGAKDGLSPEYNNAVLSFAWPLAGAGSAPARLPIARHVGFYLTAFLICSNLQQ